MSNRRTFNGLMVAIASLAGIICFENSAGAAAERSKSKPETRFERDLQSLFGAAVKTKYGEMSVRQSRDEFGRIRKQIVVGPAFSELQLDENGDGSVDVWEVSKAGKTITASQPSRGRFLRLEVSDTFAEGTQRSVYVLGLDGKTYGLLHTSFMGKKVQFNSDTAIGGATIAEGARSTGDADVPEVFEAEKVPYRPAMDSQFASKALQEIEKERFDLEEQEWNSYQQRFLGTGEICVSPDSEQGRLASLQRGWWKVLNHEVGGRKDRLKELLQTSRMIDPSCKDPKRKKELDRITDALATVMMTSSKGQPSADTQTRGRYLRCLDNSGLGIAAARIEQNFLSGHNDPYRPESMFKCNFIPGEGGGARPATGSSSAKQVTIHMCAADEGKGKNPYTADGSKQTYDNVIFHEMMHVIGYESEPMVHAAQACCGESLKDPNSRAAMCGKLDGLVREEKRFKELETFLSRGSGIAPLLAQLNVKFDAPVTAELHRKFLLGLDNFRRNSFPDGLISDVEFSKCSKVAGTKVCREQWVEHIRAYADEFFKSECRKIVPGALRSQCGKVSAQFKSDFAKYIAYSMIEVKDGTECQAKTTASVASGKWDRLAKTFFGFSVEASDDLDCLGGIIAPPSSPPPTVVVPYPGEAAPIQNPATGVDLSRKFPTFSVPGSFDRDSISAPRPGGDSSVGSSRPNPPRQPTTSPLPVTRIDTDGSAGDRRSVVEHRYREATDFAGHVNRGTRDLRDALMPRAIASERDSKPSGKADRIAPDVEFVAFRPNHKELQSAVVENPFAIQRGIASFDSAATKGGASGSASGSDGTTGAGNEAGKAGADGADSGPVASRSGVAGSRGAGARENGTAADGGATVDPGVVAKSGDGNSERDQAPGADRSSDKSGKRKPSDDSNESNALLGEITTKKYREIEDRLKDLKLQQLLISRSLRILDAEGRILGSKKQSAQCYRFVGYEQPLRTPCSE